MELVYTSQKSNFDPAKRYRNPEYFERPEAGVAKVTLIGDWPSVAEAYKAVNVEVAIVKTAKPKKAAANTFSGTRQVQTFSAPGCGPEDASAVVIPIGNYGRNDFQFEVALGSGVVEVANWMRNWSPGTFTASGSMRLLVMRFR